MSFTISISAISNPNDAGTIELDTVNTFTYSDADAARILSAVQMQFTRRARGGEISAQTGQPIPPGTVLYAPSIDECLKTLAEQFFSALGGIAVRAEQEAAARQIQAQIGQIAVTPSFVVNKGAQDVTAATGVVVEAPSP